MNEAFIEFQKKLSEFIDKECFKTNKKTGKKSLTPFGVNLLVYCSFALYLENIKLRKEVSSIW